MAMPPPAARLAGRSRERPFLLPLQRPLEEGQRRSLVALAALRRLLRLRSQRAVDVGDTLEGRRPLARTYSPTCSNRVSARRGQHTAAATVIPCWTPTGTWPGAVSSDRAGHRQVAPDRSGQCDRGRCHPGCRAGSAGINPRPGDPRPILPSSGCSVGRKRRAPDRCPRADAARDRNPRPLDQASVWRGLLSPASGHWRWAQPMSSRNVRSDRAPSARDSACSRLASLPYVSPFQRHSTPPLRDRKPALQVELA